MTKHQLITDILYAEVSEKFTYELLASAYSEKQLWAMWYKHCEVKPESKYTQDDVMYSIWLDEQRVQQKLRAYQSRILYDNTNDDDEFPF